MDRCLLYLRIRELISLNAFCKVWLNLYKSLCCLVWLSSVCAFYTSCNGILKLKTAQHCTSWFSGIKHSHRPSYLDCRSFPSIKIAVGLWSIKNKSGRLPYGIPYYRSTLWTNKQVESGLFIRSALNSENRKIMSYNKLI